MSRLVERVDAGGWSAGSCALSGWRETMEDAHILDVLPDGTALCGVFDGHCGKVCSNFSATAIHEECVRHGAPRTAPDMERLFLDVDERYLSTRRMGGSTATFAAVRPNGPDGMLVGNAGDGRAIIGRINDGALLAGAGTDGALTTDHKPDHPSERERIEAAGGSVLFIGVARVSIPRSRIALATSRSFGDREHKSMVHMSPTKQPITALPECTVRDGLRPGEFLLIGCDGVFEGQFDCRSVAHVAAKALREGQGPEGAAATVCEEAVNRGSMDNVSCCILYADDRGPHPAGLFRRSVAPVSCSVPYPLQLYRNPAEVPRRRRELLVGPMTCPRNRAFVNAWVRMAELAGMTGPQALSKRHTVLVEKLAVAEHRLRRSRESRGGAADGPFQAKVRTLFDRYDSNKSGHWTRQDADAAAADAGGLAMRDMQWRKACATAGTSEETGLPFEYVYGVYRAGQGDIDLEIRLSELAFELREAQAADPDFATPCSTEQEEGPQPRPEPEPEGDPEAKRRKIRSRVDIQNDRELVLSQLRRKVRERQQRTQAIAAGEVGEHEMNDDDMEPVRAAFQQELAFLTQGGTVPPYGVPGATAARETFFEKWLRDREKEWAQAQAAVPMPGRARARVRVAPLEMLKAAIELHPALKWDDRLAFCCGTIGAVIRMDPSDGTARVLFPAAGYSAWLPVRMLTPLSEERRPVLVAAEPDALRKAVTQHAALNWDEDFTELSGKVGLLMQLDNQDHTAQVEFTDRQIRCWLPQSVLSFDVKEAKREREGDAGGDEAPKRPRSAAPRLLSEQPAADGEDAAPAWTGIAGASDDDALVET
eukprot:TRINITY_DN47241_c0_g1_i1.p1 TRINITY_DN47241_c0_g1~~TRINITY_DN47241_c0_g1_i1.p1  ORF type:complete len:861 (+),score=275.14 TRINITY_DN47241_c0_g1_i1:116-2584(+)